MALKVVFSLNLEAWSNFVSEHPEGNIFHTPEVFLSYKRAKLFSPLLLAVVDNSRIVGLMTALIQYERKGIFRYFTSRSVLMGMPLVNLKEDNKEISQILFKAYDDKISDKVIFTEIRNWGDTRIMKSFFSKHNYDFIEHENLIIDLTKGQDKIWDGMNKKRRNSIRNAKKKEVKIRALSSEKELQKGYNIIKNTYRQARLPVPEYDFFNNMYSYLNYSDKAHVLLATYNSEIIGIIFLLKYKETVLNWYNASDPMFFNRNPNDILVWESILWSLENNFKIFDFGGLGTSGKLDGIRNFKQKFGGEKTAFGRYKKVHAPILWYIVDNSLKLLQKINAR